MNVKRHILEVLFLLILLMKFPLPASLAAEADVDNDVPVQARLFMSKRGYETRHVGIERVLTGWDKKEVAVVSGEYLEGKTKGKVPYGRFLLFFTRSPAGRFLTDKQNLILDPSGHGLAIQFLDLNKDSDPDFILRAVTDRHSTTIYFSSLSGNHVRFKKVYYNDSSNLYPFDLDRDGIPEFIVPSSGWLAITLLLSQCLYSQLSDTVKDKISVDYDAAAGDYKRYHQVALTELEQALTVGYYFHPVSILSLSKSRPEDVSSRYRRHFGNRMNIISEALKSEKLLTSPCVVELQNTLNYFKRIGYRVEDRETRAETEVEAHAMRILRDFGKKVAPSCSIIPCRLRGEFDGDGKEDVAVLVKRLSNGYGGIAFLHGNGKSFLQGAVTFEKEVSVDTDSSKHRWEIYKKGKVGQGMDPRPPPKLLGDAIYSEVVESSSALIYWTGKSYDVYHLGD